MPQEGKFCFYFFTLTLNLLDWESGVSPDTCYLHSQIISFPNLPHNMKVKQGHLAGPQKSRSGTSMGPLDATSRKYGLGVRAQAKTLI